MTTTIRTQGDLHRVVEAAITEVGSHLYRRPLVDGYSDGFEWSHSGLLIIVDAGTAEAVARAIGRRTGEEASDHTWLGDRNVWWVGRVTVCDRTCPQV